MVSLIDLIDHMCHCHHEASCGGQAGVAAAGNPAVAGLAGMGKKSNSTSQLLAAGNNAFISQHIILTCFMTIS